MNELERIVAATREELERRRRAVPAAELERGAITDGARAGVFESALRRPGISLIAEHKRRSPSAGSIRESASLEEVVGAYERGGAAALSILTDEPSFGGSLDDLRAARAITELPILRKDFIVDPYQLYEAVAAGADAVLLIVAALEARELRELHVGAHELGLATLVEVHDEQELKQALAAGADVIGINNRDLATLSVDTSTTFALRAKVPDGTVVVAESGFSRREQLDELASEGVDAVLVGEALMRSDDIEQACRNLTAAL
jgi:indole-3-glycerol phosphate synthase